ncbi:MAG TPA: hypothetical protein VGV61_12825, partial [Thermoanaerobaculia bacterium]|nr:hypothetical protein [Thermoanaerobaculia bacterium]
MRPAASPAPAAAAALLAALAAAAAAGAIDRHPPRPSARVWYVDNTAVADGDGSMVAPFDRLTRAVRAADAGDTIYVFRGDGTERALDEPVRLRPFQRLVGSGVAFDAGGEAPLPAGEPPLLASAEGPVVTLADHASVEGVALASGGEAVLVGRAVHGFRLVGLRVDGRGTATAGIDLQDVVDATLEQVTVTGAARFGIRLERAGQVALRACRVTATGTAAGDAGVLVRAPSGTMEIASSEIGVRAGAALAVETSHGEARIALEGVELVEEDGPLPASGLVARADGDADLRLVVGTTVLSRLAADGFSLVAAGQGRLSFELAGSGAIGDVGGAPTRALVAAAHDGGGIELVARGDDLLARDTGLTLEATGSSRLRASLERDALKGAGATRGVVVLLSDDAEAALALTGNELAGQVAEAVYVAAAGRSRLGVEARDNVVGEPADAPSVPLPSVRIETRDSSGACVALANNRIADGPGGGPAVALRQLGESALALSGYTPAATGGGAAQALAATNRVGRVEIVGDRELTATAGPSCPPPALGASTRGGRGAAFPLVEDRLVGEPLTTPLNRHQ